MTNPSQRRERGCAHPCIFTYRSEIQSTKKAFRDHEDIVFYDVKRRSLSPLRNGIKILTLKEHFRMRGAKARLNVDRILAKKKQPRSTKKFEVSAFLRSEKGGTFAPLTRKDHSWSARRSKRCVLQRGNDLRLRPSHAERAFRTRPERES